jgi:hypothetical protein
MVNVDENLRTPLYKNPLLWKILIGFIISVLLLVIGKYINEKNFFRAEKPKLVAIVKADAFGIPQQLTEKPEFQKLKTIKTYAFIRIQNEGDKPIEDVVFNFATASYINLCYADNCRDNNLHKIWFLNERRISLGKFPQGYKADISLWTNESTSKVYPEEITNEIIKDIHIYPQEGSIKQLFSYYTPEGKKRLTESP